MIDPASPAMTFEQFSAAMLESAHLHTDVNWIIARTRLDHPINWLGGFASDRPVWVPDIDGAVTYTRDDAELAVRRCTVEPNPDNVHYAVCHLKNSEQQGL